jgi:hypothetical protein
MLRPFNATHRWADNGHDVGLISSRAQQAIISKWAQPAFSWAQLDSFKFQNQPSRQDQPTFLYSSGKLRRFIYSATRTVQGGRERERESRAYSKMYTARAAYAQYKLKTPQRLLLPA